MKLLLMMMRKPQANALNSDASLARQVICLPFIIPNTLYILDVIIILTTSALCSNHKRKAEKKNELKMNRACV